MVLSSVPELFVVIRHMVLVGGVLDACQMLPVQYQMKLGKVTLGDILEILPFEDPIVVLELDGQRIWDALEASLETWPAQEGRVNFTFAC